MIDFVSAETFLKQAKQAHENGDETMFVAARKMVALALEIEHAPPDRKIADKLIHS